MKCIVIFFLFVCYVQFSLIRCCHENKKAENVMVHRRSEARKSGHTLHHNGETYSTPLHSSKHRPQSRRSHKQTHMSNRRSHGNHAEQDWLGEKSLPDHHIQRNIRSTKILLGNAEARVSNYNNTKISNDDISILRLSYKTSSHANNNSSTSRRSNAETSLSSNEKPLSNSSDYSTIRHSNDETAETQAVESSNKEKLRANNETYRVRRSNYNIGDNFKVNYESLSKEQDETRPVLMKDQDEAHANDNDNTVVIGINDIDETENEVKPSSWSARSSSLLGLFLPRAPHLHSTLFADWSISWKSLIPRTKRMINARYATLEDYPYVVTILKHGEHWCSGALVSHRAVITSANCFLKPDPNMSVLVGTRHAAFGGHLVPIQEVMYHPNWTQMDEPSPDFDVAVLVLNKTIEFADDLHAVELPPESIMPPFNDAWVTSFGTKNPDGVYDILDGDLEVYRTTLINMTYCKNVTKLYRTKVTGTHICLSQKDHKAPCTRDTGAPAVSDGYLWGVASWGIRKRCGGLLVPAMFSYLGAPDNADFIKNALFDIHRRYPHKNI